MRAEYARKHCVYAHVGSNVFIQSRFIPIYSELISFGNNVLVARNVDFITHDAIHIILNRLPHCTKGDVQYKEHIGCIEVKDNVMIGSNSIILYNVSIGPNTIIAAGSVVVKDCEPNSVYAGVPAKKIGTFDEYILKRKKKEENGTFSVTTHNQHLNGPEIAKAWDVFYKNHNR